MFPNSPCAGDVADRNHGQAHLGLHHVQEDRPAALDCQVSARVALHLQLLPPHLPPSSPPCCFPPSLPPSLNTYLLLPPSISPPLIVSLLLLPPSPSPPLNTSLLLPHPSLSPPLLPACLPPPPPGRCAAVSPACQSPDQGSPFLSLGKIKSTSVELGCSLSDGNDLDSE